MSKCSGPFSMVWDTFLFFLWNPLQRAGGQVIVSSSTRAEAFTGDHEKWAHELRHPNTNTRNEHVSWNVQRKSQEMNTSTRLLIIIVLHILLPPPPRPLPPTQGDLVSVFLTHFNFWFQLYLPTQLLFAQNNQNNHQFKHFKPNKF